MKIVVRRSWQSKLLWVILLLAFIKPPYFGIIAGVDKIFNVIRVLTVVFIAGYYMLVRKKFPRLSFLLLIYSIVPLLATIINSGNIYNAFSFCAVSVGSAMIMELGAEKKSYILIDALYLVLELLVYANLITILLFPHGLYLFKTSIGWMSDQAWVLGLRNAQTTYLLLACIVDVVYWNLKTRKTSTNIRCLCLYIAVFVSISILKTGSGLISFFLMTFLIVLTYSTSICIQFSYVAVGHLLLFILMTSLGSLSSFAEFGNFWGQLVGRASSVSARFHIWTVTWGKVLSAPIFGYGILKERQLLWLSLIAAGATTTHNTFLDMWFRGGVICFGLFCLILLYLNRKLMTLKEEYKILYNICAISFLAFFVIVQAEGAMSGTTMYILIALLWVLPDIAKERKDDSKH